MCWAWQGDMNMKEACPGPPGARRPTERTDMRADARSSGEAGAQEVPGAEAHSQSGQGHMQGSTPGPEQSQEAAENREQAGSKARPRGEEP